MSDIIKTGVLVKKSRNRGLSFGDKWQERRINLMKGAVTYGTVDGATKDSVHLDTSTVVEISDLGKDQGKSLRIQTGDEELVLCCPDEASRDEWIKAIKDVAHDSGAPPAAEPDNSAADRARLEAEAAEAAKKKAAELDLWANYEKELAAFNKAQEDKRKMQARLQNPVECSKKLDTESSFHHPRFIWVNANTKEFHWAKSADDMTKSKCINIVTNVTDVIYNAIPDEVEPNMTIKLNENVSELPDTVFATGMFKSARPTTIEIKMPDAATCSAFVTYLKEIKNPPPEPVAPSKPTLPNVSMPNIGGMSMGMPSASGMMGSLAKSAAHSAGVPTSASSAVRSVL